MKPLKTNYHLRMVQSSRRYGGVSLAYKARSTADYRPVGAVSSVRLVRSGKIQSSYGVTPTYMRSDTGSGTIIQILFIILITMLFFTSIKYFYGSSDRVYLFTDMINFFANLGNLTLTIPTIQSVSTGIAILDTLLNSLITGVNCLTFIFSSLVNLVVFAFRFVQFLFFY